MHFEAIILFDVFLYLFISRFCFRFYIFYLLLCFSQRNLPFFLAKFNFYADTTVGFFVGQKNQRLDFISP